MSALLNLMQGSAAWRAHRAQYRNASVTAAVLGVSPWMTPYQLWCLRTGRTQQEVTPAMQRGSDLEPKARAAYEQFTGHVMEPVVMVDGDYSAGLDGLTLAGDFENQPIPVTFMAHPIAGRPDDGTTPCSSLVWLPQVGQMWALELLSGLFLTQGQPASSQTARISTAPMTC